MTSINELHVRGNVLILRVDKLNIGSAVWLQTVSETANHICANFMLRGTYPQTKRKN